MTDATEEVVTYQATDVTDGNAVFEQKAVRDVRQPAVASSRRGGLLGRG